MASLPQIIAIDGPAASGKSTVAEKVAQRIGYVFFDTGVMYRAVTLAALRKLGGVSSEQEVTALSEKIIIDFQAASKADGRKCDILVDGEDVTWDVRTPEVDANVSPVSAYPGVRKAMTEQQRRIGLKGHVVMVGRDIGTVVLPEADLKIYLDASAEERALRRFREMSQRGDSTPYEQVLESMKRRDQIDSTRAVAPLKPADDAVVLLTDGMGIDQVVEKIESLIRNR